MPKRRPIITGIWETVDSLRNGEDIPDTVPYAVATPSPLGSKWGQTESSQASPVSEHCGCRASSESCSVDYGGGTSPVSAPLTIDSSSDNDDARVAEELVFMVPVPKWQRPPEHVVFMSTAEKFARDRGNTIVIPIQSSAIAVAPGAQLVENARPLEKAMPKRYVWSGSTSASHLFYYVEGLRRVCCRVVLSP